MSTRTQTQTHSDSNAKPVLKLRGEHDHISKALEQLDKQGWTVVPGVLSEERAEHYRDALYTWLESFNLGFNRDDPSTWTWEKLPKSSRGGLYNRYGIGHEQFAWDLRTEPALIDVFARVWGTDQLLVSFDGHNVSLPMNEEQRALSLADYQPWPHTDQSGLRRYKHCIQGIANFAENGPDDGGLKVLEGSAALWDEFLDAHDGEKPEGGWPSRDSFMIQPAHEQWFFDRGCEWHKVCAKPGDVLLWDSRCIHQGSPPELGGKVRMASYVCYKPASLISSERLSFKQDVARRCGQTSHDPIEFRETGIAAQGGQDSITERTAPLTKPNMSDRALQLAGLKAY